MTSLKEEIQNYIDNCMMPEGDSYTPQADEILVTIKKRIDERFKKFEKEDSDLDIYRGYEMAIDDIKELLK